MGLRLSGVANVWGPAMEVKKEVKVPEKKPEPAPTPAAASPPPGPTPEPVVEPEKVRTGSHMNKPSASSEAELDVCISDLSTRRSPRS